MRVRIISSLILSPLFLIIVFLGGISLKIGVIFASLVGMYEFYKAFSKKINHIHIIGFFFALVYIIFIEKIIQRNLLNAFSSLFMIILLMYSVVFYKHDNIKEVIITFFGFYYVCFLISHIYLIRNFEYGTFFVWLPFISAWGCDTGAYFTGMSIGKHKLTPVLSPKKTIEGSIGGILSATLLSLIFAFVVKGNFNNNSNIILIFVLSGFVGSIVSQIGDLAASAVKRYMNIKDFGHIIPGHGGILDRFDSVLFTAPIVYYFIIFLANYNFG